MRILAWMCVLIAVNQLGFGSIVPALALYARSFDVTQSAIGLAIAVYGLARFLIAVPPGSSRTGSAGGPRSPRAASSRRSGTLCALAPTYAAFVGARFVAGAGTALVLTTGPIALGLATDLAGAGAALGGTAVLLVAVALLFARLAPETFQAGRF
ncbi:MAG: hypothetical protein ACREJS_11080 [Candidatus Rokuibacteriota bacterium]